MNTKKTISLCVAISSLVFLAGCWSIKSGTGEETIKDTTVTSGTTETTGITTSNVTTSNDRCIELMAYSLKAAEYQTKWDMNAVVERAQKVDKLTKSYNMNQTEYESLCKGYFLDPKFMEKVQKRVKEL